MQSFEFEWMWADAGFIPFLGHTLAEANPFRWENGSANEILKRLQGKSRFASKHKNRRVQLRYKKGAGEWSRSNFERDPKSAVEWIRKIIKTTEQQRVADLEPQPEMQPPAAESTFVTPRGYINAPLPAW